MHAFSAQRDVFWACGVTTEKSPGDTAVTVYFYLRVVPQRLRGTNHNELGEPRTNDDAQIWN